MLVRDVLNKKGNKVFTASKDTHIGEIANTLAKENIGAIVVLENDLVAGILSERDIVKGFTEKKSVRNTKAKELMTKKQEISSYLHFQVSLERHQMQKMLSSTCV